ncbi:transcriptional regulator, TetR family [Colwellia chukchiensis]|uniref:Transcriptional regulator, TetR family n=1 Tax=Colwellia chukchiensis TaxID=641665 RepID=A0A1H7LYM5_9GAMM|nr:TetR family transcriptional regulator [Colwellia chukchiensis]SEL04076.1 transcriptional regulator, TetR family [Colwellia chukchiensis]
MLTNTPSVPVKRRRKGEQTKNLILESAIIVLAQHGVKGTTHRAIAEQAKLQLSLTTYYFKDIQALIQQAFSSNCQYLLTARIQRWQAMLAVITTIPKAALRTVKQRRALLEQLTDLLLAALEDTAQNHRHQQVVEQLLLTEALVSPSLQALTQQHYQACLKPCLALCQYFSADSAQTSTKAEILMTQIQHLEYRHLLFSPAQVNTTQARAWLQVPLAMALSLKSP